MLFIEIESCMKEQFSNIRQAIIVFMVALALQACGGSSNNTPQYSVSADVENISFSTEFLQISDETIAINVNFVGEGLLVGFSPEVQPVPWLTYRTEQITESTATIYIDVVNAELFVPGTFETILRLSSGNQTEFNFASVDIDVSLLIWQLSTNTDRVTFNGTFGDSSIPAQSIELTSETNEWTAAADVDWLTLDITSGTGDAVIIVTPTIDTFTAAGLQQANIILTEKSTGASKSLPVELGLDNVYLFADQANIAFTATKNIQATTKTVTISTNKALPFAWQASADASWLTLTINESSNKIAISADPSSVPINEISTATITVSATDDDTVINEVITVNLYRSDLTSDNNRIEEVLVNTNSVTVSPTLPYLYFAQDNQLKVYHQYSAQLLQSIVISPEETLLEQFVIHPNGKLLLARAFETLTNDDGSSETILHRYKINLVDYSITEITDADIEFEPMRFVRFNGRYFVVTQTLEYADENLKRLYWDIENAFLASAIDFASQTNTLFALDNNTVSFKRFTGQVNDFTQAKIMTTLTHEYHPESLADGELITDFVVSEDEKNLFAISPSSEWISFDGETFTDHGLLETTPNVFSLFINKTSNSRAHYFRINTSNNLGFYVDVYNEQQVVSAKLYTAGNQPSAVSITADDKRLLVNATSASQIELTNLMQFETSANSLNFDSTFGDATIPEQQITLTGVGDNWQATANVPWLILTSDTSNNANTLTVNIDSSSITTWGLFSGQIVLYDPASDNSTVINVEFAVDAVRISSNFPALSFIQLDTQQKLNHQVDILFNSETNIAWQASANVDWLILTPDTQNNTLSISADPTQVSSSGISYAEISLDAIDENQAQGSTIKVSLYKDANDAGDVVISNIVPNDDAVVVDPLRPYIYFASADMINIYNILTGDLVNTIESPLTGVDLTNLVVHPDGSILLASNIETYFDDNDQEQTRINHYQVNLSNQTISQLDSTAITIENRPMKITMVDGMAVVITQTLEFANLELTRQYQDIENGFLTSIIGDAASTNTILAYNINETSLNAFTLAYNSFSSQSISAKPSNDYINPLFSTTISSLSLSKMGEDIYTAIATLNPNDTTEFSSYDGNAYTDQGLLHNNSNYVTFDTMIDSADNSYFYRFDRASSDFNITIYDSSQIEISSQILSIGTTNGQSFLVADYSRVIIYDNTDKELSIAPIL